MIACHLSSEAYSSSESEDKVF